jgi:hypothetical protein
MRAALALAGLARAGALIDRRAVVARHNVRLGLPIDATGVTPLGNGAFAFNVDVTGLQSLNASYPAFDLNTLADWAWHTQPGTRALLQACALQQPHGREHQPDHTDVTTVVERLAEGRKRRNGGVIHRCEVRARRPRGGKPRGERRRHHDKERIGAKNETEDDDGDTQKDKHATLVVSAFAVSAAARRFDHKYIASVHINLRRCAKAFD